MSSDKVMIKTMLEAQLPVIAHDFPLVRDDLVSVIKVIVANVVDEHAEQIADECIAQRKRLGLIPA
jgi:hypothetical protein